MKKDSDYEKYGYRVKLNDYIGSDLDFKSFLDEYFKYYKIMEIKVNRKIENCKNMITYLNLLYIYYNSRFSYHFNKYLLNNCTLSELERKILKLSEIYSINLTYYITHLNNDYMDKSYLENINEISNFFQGKNVLLLENPIVSKDIYAYLENITDLMKKLDVNNKNIGFCLDFGHLFYNNDDCVNILNFIKKIKLDEYILECHVHNVYGGNDHFPPGIGKIDYSYIMKWIRANIKNPRIILECDVKNMATDGIENILKLKQ